MKKDIVLSQEEIAAITKRIGFEIDEKIKNDEKTPVLVGVLKGAAPFMMDVIRNISTPIFTDFIQIKSYLGMSTTGKVQLLKDVSYDCEGRTVIIIEDIVDTGYSMDFLIKHFKSHNPKQVFVCTLFDKKEARKVEVPIDFVGKELVGNKFLIGYGLDYYELCRNIPYVYNATEENVAELDKILKK